MMFFYITNVEEKAAFVFVRLIQLRAVISLSDYTK